MNNGEQNLQCKAEWPKIILGKNNRIDLRRAFDIFDVKGKGLVSVDLIKIALRALGYDLSFKEFEKIKSYITNTHDGSTEIDYRSFEMVMEERMLIKDNKTNNEKSFQLILDIDDRNKTEIDSQHLRVVAEYLNEEITNDEIDEMITLLLGERSNSVDINSFLGILSMTKPSRLNGEEKQ